jgi:UDP-glucose 4-epimerase
VRGRICITGGAGFIGSNFAIRLCSLGAQVVVIDNFRTGRRRFLSDIVNHPNFQLVEGDVLDTDLLDKVIPGANWVIHLQANADVRHGLEHPVLDLEQNTIATSRVLEAMRRAGVSRIAFASTGSVYGEPDIFPTREDAPFPVQTSLYGASKLACEALIEAYCIGYEMTGLIFRFVSILGEHYTHGHVIDFYRSLKGDSRRIRVLGNGEQQKSYLYVQDCISAMLAAIAKHENDTGAEIYNLGTDETITVDESLLVIASTLGCDPDVEHEGGARGWPGDSPLIHLDTKKIRSLGWSPELTIREAIIRTVEWLQSNEQISTESSSVTPLRGKE